MTGPNRQQTRHVSKMYGTPPDPHVVASLRAGGGLDQAIRPKLVTLLEAQRVTDPGTVATQILDLVETELRLAGVNLDDQVEKEPGT
jgi:hypothetical protein